MNRSLYTACVVIFITISGCRKNQSNQTMESVQGNPFALESSLPYHTIPFDKIKDEDYKVGFYQGMKAHTEEIIKISSDTSAATFENTLLALELSGGMLNRVNAAFNVVTGANTNDYLQALQEEISPLLAAHNDSVFLDNKIFDRVKDVYDQRSSLNLDPESLRLLDHYYKKFVMAGAQLPDDKKTQLKKLNEKEAILTTKFSNKLLSGTKAGALLVNDKSKLNGLADDEVNAAALNAEEAGHKGAWMIPLYNTTQQPNLMSLSDRNTRHQLFNASWNRTERGDSNDVQAIIIELSETRAQKAKLLGYKNYAAWSLQNQMAKSPEQVMTFLGKMTKPAVGMATKEADEIQKLIAKEGGDFKLEPWDWNYYAEKVRKAKYDLDENQIKEYFEADSVLINGVFWAATQLYGITFKLRNDIPVYHPDVKVYEIFDQDNAPMALYYCDFYKRDNKNGGAWMSNMVEQSTLLKQKPVIYNVFNYAKPSQGKPSLINYDDVSTMFHEFGHTLHGLFANQKYTTLSGTNVPRDFVEYPSQVNEIWALYPEVLKNYAKHYKTKSPMPEELIAKINKASKFNGGYALTEFLAAANLDMMWHTLSGDKKVQDVDQFELDALKNTGIYMSQVPPRYRSSYFLHIWANGYSAGYYAYLWAEMLDKDTAEWFRENGGLTRENGQKFREMILSIGNSKDLDLAFKEFRGRSADIQPLLKAKGIQELN